MGVPDLLYDVLRSLRQSSEHQCVGAFLGVELVEVGLGNSSLEGDVQLLAGGLAEPLLEALLVLLGSSAFSLLLVAACYHKGCCSKEKKKFFHHS